MRLTSFEQDWQQRFSNVAKAKKENHEMCFMTKSSVAGTTDYFFIYLQKYIQQDNSQARVLDVGCGPGVLSKELGERGYRVEGIDFSQAMIEAAQKAEHPDNVHYQTGDIYAIPFPDASFDIVICLGVFQTVENPEKAVQEMIAKLKPGGLLILTTLNTFSLVSLVRKLTDKNSTLELRRYSPYAFERLLKSTGTLENIRVKGVYVFPAILSPLAFIVQKLRFYVLFNLLWPLFNPLSHSFYMEAKKK